MQAKVIDGKYQVVRLLGEGGMGAVYEARHMGTGRRVALKVIVSEALASSPDIVARFQREARAAGAIESQHIAHVLDTGVDRDTGSPYMVMEFLQGEDISQAIERIGPFHPELALRVMAQACVGLQKAHDAGVTHRDIKPANIYLAAQDGGELIVKLLDFGIAKVRMEQLHSAENAALTRTGSMLGSPLYMSPEQAKGAKTTDHRTDIWSLGVVLYESLTGVTPHGQCDTLGGLILAICSEEPRVVQEHAPWVPTPVAAIVHKALARDVNVRFQSAGEMAAAIRALLPNGQSVNREMFVPLAPHIRAQVAPRLVMSNPGMAISGPGVAPVGATTTSGGVTQVTPPRSHGGAVVAASLVALATLGVGGFFAYRHFAVKPPVTMVVQSASIDQPPPPAPSSTVSDPPPAHTGALTIVPPTASVQVDGTTVPVSNGSVSIIGALGSMHHVRVVVGKKETIGDVVIAEGGIVPSKIELGVAPPKPPPVAVAAGQGASSGSKPNVPTPTAATPPPPKPPAPTPTGVDRNFN
jgi:serine/threonine-protein kinase